MPAEVDLVLQEAQRRRLYQRDFLNLVEQTLAAADPLIPTDAGSITGDTHVAAAAVRLIKALTPHHTVQEQGAFAICLEAVAVKTVQDRALKRAGRAASPAPLTRPAQLNPVNWLRVSTEERQLINLIAASIIRGSVVDLDEPPEEPPPARQPKRDALEQAMRTAGRRAYSWAKLAAQELLADDLDLAREYARAAQIEDLRYADAQRFLAAIPARLHTGRYHRGVVFRISVPRSVTEVGPDNVPVQRVVYDARYFTLAVVWSADVYSLQVANGTEIEARSGIDVGDSGWSAFIVWLHFQDRRLQGAGGGRPVSDLTHLIYREHHGALETRQVIRDQYPGAIRVFEALRRTLSVRADDQLGTLATYREDELQWRDEDPDADPS